MTRVTRDLAHIIKDLILAKRKKEIIDLIEKAKQESYEYIKSTLPSGMFEMYQKHKSYFQSTNVGITRLTYFDVELPSNIGRSTLRPTSMSPKIMAIASELETLECKYRCAENELVPYLIKLRTINNVNKMFPELNLVENPKVFLPTTITPDLLAWLRK